MNVYDFDGTIYDGDCSLDFFFYCLLREPHIFSCLKLQILGLGKYSLRLCSKEYFKSMFFSFLKNLTDVDNAILLFWNKYMDRIKPWYLEQSKINDVVVSASPDFLLQEVTRRLNTNEPIATIVDKHTGKLIGKNCYGEEKVRRFYMKHPDTPIARFYSDSYSDLPLAQKAKEAFFVKKNRITSWNI